MRKFTISDLRNKHFLALTGNAVISLLALVTMALLYRSLGKADVGTWFFFLTILGLGDALRNGLLSTATVKFYAGTANDRAEEVLGSVWYLASMLTLLMIVLDGIFICCIPFIKNELLVISVKWFGITILSTLPSTITFWILVADEKYGKILLLRLANNGSMIVIIFILFLLNKMTIQALLWCNLATNILTSIIGMVWGLSRFRTIAKRTTGCVKELFHFGKYSLATSTLSRLFQNTDIYIITFLLGPAAVAIYNIPIKLMEFIEMPLRSFIGTGMSAIAAAHNNNDSKKATYILEKYSGMLTIAFIPATIFVLFFAEIAIEILGGRQYLGTEAANIYRIFMLFALMYPIDRFNGVALDMVHQPKINFYKVIIMLVINVAGDFLGIYLLHNMYGAALATFLTIISGVIFGYIQLRKYMEFSVKGMLVMGYHETRLLVKNALGK